MKSKKVEVLIKVLIPVAIVSVCFGVEKLISLHTEKSFNKPIIINSKDLSLDDDGNSLEVVSKEAFGDVKGLTANFGFINDNEVLLGIGLSREEFYNKYPNELDKENEANNKLIQERDNDLYYGKMYVFNLKDESKKSLNIDAKNVFSDMICGGNKFSYVNDEKFYLYDLNKESSIMYRDTDDIPDKKNIPDYEIGSEYMGNWSKDGKCLINYEDGNINVYNAEENSSKSFKVDSDNRYVKTMPSYYSKDGKDIYFIGVKYKRDMNSEGIFKLDTVSGNVEEVLLLPYTDYNKGEEQESIIPNNEYSVLENGKRIIFNGVIDGIDGTYIYDVENNKFYNVLPHTVKGDDGAYCLNIWVSPDESKIVYITLADENGKKHWNLYAAKISGNSLTDRICIYKDINLCGEKITWSSDSKKILFFTANEDIEKNNMLFKDKNEINIITFK